MGGVTTIAERLSPDVHVYVEAPEAVKVAEEPGQIDAELAVIVIDGVVTQLYSFARKVFP